MATIPATSGFAGTVHLWFREQCGLNPLQSFHEANESPFIRAAAVPPVSAPVSSRPPDAKILSYDEAPFYGNVISSAAAGWLSMLHGESRLLAAGLELYSALQFIGQTDLTREYGVEWDTASGIYRLVGGVEENIMMAGNRILHTHGQYDALPSFGDLEACELEAISADHKETFIYSQPAGERQLSHVIYREPRHYDVYFYRFSPAVAQPAAVRYFQFKTWHSDVENNHEVGGSSCRELDAAGNILYQSALDMEALARDLRAQPGHTNNAIYAALQKAHFDFYASIVQGNRQDATRHQSP